MMHRICLVLTMTPTRIRSNRSDCDSGHALFGCSCRLIFVSESAPNERSPFNLVGPIRISCLPASATGSSYPTTKTIQVDSGGSSDIYIYPVIINHRSSSGARRTKLTSAVRLHHNLSGAFSPIRRRPKRMRPIERSDPFGPLRSGSDSIRSCHEHRSDRSG